MEADLLILATLLASLATSCYGQVLLSKLPKTLIVDTSPSGTVNLAGGVGQITIKWELNKSSSSSSNNINTSSYKTVKVKLCYLPESQIDRPWRKTKDDLAKDKTCQHEITSKPYVPTNNSFTYTVDKDVPTAQYFVRVYVVDDKGTKVAYGQTKDVRLSITAISGRSTSIDIASAVFSAFSVVSLGGFFYLEKKKAKRVT